MAAPSQLVLRARASTSLLASLRGTKAFGQVSRAEAAHLKALIQSSGHADRDQIQALAETIRAAGFQGKDQSDLLDAVAEVAAAAPAAPEMPSKGGQQDFESAVFFVPKAMWDQLARTANTEEVFALYGKLGLRQRFSEGTMHALGLVILCVTEGVDETLRMAPAARTNSIKPIKAAYKRFAADLPSPPVWVEKLPSSPEALRAQHPEVFKAAYPDGLGEMQFPLPVRVFRELVSVTKMRVHGSSKKSPSASVMSAAPMTEMGMVVSMLGEALKSVVQQGQPKNDIGLRMLTQTPRSRPHVSPAPPLPIQDKASEDEAEEVDQHEAGQEQPAEAKKPLTVDEATKALLAKSGVKRKAGGPPAAKAKAKAKAKPMKAAKDSGKGYKATVTVSYSHEKSRQQFLGRCSETKSAAFCYKGKSKNAVENEVKAWCREQRKKFMVPISPKFKA
ncbi:unnamed protein product [Prorocentrum cordatum]|uniref:Uncharacterized protein n=1 Tax=Prorocentrum cordatum TaxID=2364126 RepID=A0ABN9TVE4_9DINO|nr:unnamed protein product [Polarella glacialis]